MNPNWLAYLTMAIWPFVVLFVFQQRRGRERVARTVTWMMLLAIMFLPSSCFLDAPLIPPLDKSRITALAVRLALEVFHRKELLKRAPLFRMPQVIAILLLIGAYKTTMTNSDPLHYGPLTLPGLAPSDTLSLAIGTVLDVYIPFTIAQRVFTTERDLRDLFDVMTRCLLIYIPFILYELRMAPVLHEKIYGYSAWSFGQGIRAGGYRPAVFMGHGLVLATFVFSIYTAARGQWAAGLVTKPLKSNLMVLLFTAILLLCKTLATNIYGLLALIMIRRPVRARTLAAFLWITSLAVALYPWSRVEGLFPVYEFVEWANQASAQRGQSLEFRFINEDMLLTHGMQRPVWGWGFWGRNRVFSEDGFDISVTDGHWIMWFGSIGQVGMGLNLAITVLPMLRAARRLKKMKPSAAPMVGAIGVMCAGLAIDIIPNSRADYMAMFLGGALWTLSETMSRPGVKTAPAKQPQPVPKPQQPAPTSIPA